MVISTKSSSSQILHRWQCMDKSELELSQTQFWIEMRTSPTTEVSWNETTRPTSPPRVPPWYKINIPGLIQTLYEGKNSLLAEPSAAGAVKVKTSLLVTDFLWRSSDPPCFSNTRFRRIRDIIEEAFEWGKRPIHLFTYHLCAVS